MKAIPIGISDYRKLRQNDYYYVDKTLIIKEFLEKKSQVTLITRPRRFGKTINMSMMAEFFDITKDSKEIFKGTKIMDTPYAKEINQYPTIFISFADAKRDKTSVVSTVKDQILKEWDRYNYVFNNLSKYEQNKHDVLENILMNYLNGSLEGIGDAISFLMEKLQSYYNEEVMVFVDEYDTPFIESHVNCFYDEVRGGLSSLLHNSLKTSNSLKYAMLTGIQRVAKENIFSDLNNLDVYTVLDNGYNNFFGFDNEETQQILEYYHLKLDDKVREMYDGYKMGNIEIYNPWSILNYAKRQELIPYWVNTSANVMIKDAITKSDDDFKNEYEKLITNGQIETIVSMQTSFYEEADNSTLWGLFVNAGYLTVKQIIDRYNDRYCIMIPNAEVRKEFINLTEYQLGLKNGKLFSVVSELIEEKPEAFLEQYQSILMIPSYHDLMSENSYHMMMLGMCLCYSSQYDVISNREVGKGRNDIILKAKDKNKTSFILEFKYFKEDKKNSEKILENLANEAIQQIKDRKYDFELTGKVIYIGLAHHGKDVVMKWKEKNNV
ncbi:MAG: AAA family ATPase [Faecalibacillus sp.]|uniref:AAA family ATPase n=1 Tax=Faecalibacillus sp. TaxID=2678891 RepID=UPI00399B1D30